MMEFDAGTIGSLSSRVEACCESVLYSGNLDRSAESELNDAASTLETFLASLKKAEEEIGSSGLTCEVRRAAYSLRQKADVILRAIRATCRSVGVQCIGLHRELMTSPRR
jgi:hypothetical protein